MCAPDTRPRRASEGQQSSPEAELNSTTFLKSPKILRARFRWMTSFTSPSPIWDFYFDISEWYTLSACAWTPALMLHLTKPCAKWKVLSLTKPKGKIYKTKSLGHHITKSYPATKNANWSGQHLHCFVSWAWLSDSLLRMVGWFGGGLWHINLCRLFNVKSIFI